MKKLSTSIVFTILAFCVFGQNNIGFSMMGAYQRSVEKYKLNTVKTLKDINPGYPSSWVTGYETVEVQLTKNGKTTKAIGKSEALTSKQIALLKTANLGDQITFYVKYSPDSKESKEIRFSYAVMPKHQPEFQNGYKDLTKYVNENVINQIPLMYQNTIKEAVVTFTLNEDGTVSNLNLKETSGFKSVDELLIDSVKNMPKWTPAKLSSGKACKQEMEFKIGTMVGC